MAYLWQCQGSDLQPTCVCSTSDGCTRLVPDRVLGVNIQSWAMFRALDKLWYSVLHCDHYMPPMQLGYQHLNKSCARTGCDACKLGHCAQDMETSPCRRQNEIVPRNLKAFCAWRSKLSLEDLVKPSITGFTQSTTAASLWYHLYYAALIRSG